MSKLLMKFYEEVMQYENSSIEFGKKLDEEANRLLTFHKDKFNEEEMEVIKGLMYQLAYEAEKTGYILGVKSAIQIYSELFDTEL